MGENDAQEQASANADSDDCVSVVGEAILDAALQALNTIELKNEPLR